MLTDSGGTYTFATTDSLGDFSKTVDPASYRAECGATSAALPMRDSW
jgi:hypothetical protein